MKKNQTIMEEGYYTYALRSINRNYIYVGLTNNIERRIEEHNKGYNKTTRAYAPFQLIYKKRYPTRIEARKQEKYLKTGFGKEYLKRIKDQ
jgi:putative endonuclease